jgi:outer membrane protein OmpA-like peptidoglycan-associated protein
MLIKRIFLLALTLLICGTGTSFASNNNDLQIKVVKPGAKVTVDQIFRDGTLLVDVVDAKKNPVFGLSAKDFSVTQSGRKAKITSVTLLSESMDVPRHIVLVLDNSFSMDQRNAIKPLLSGVGELLKIVRPIDDVQIVVFDSNQKIKVDGRELRVKTFHSKQPAELMAFAEKAYHKDGITSKTVLYEGMLAGLDLIGKAPAGEPRFMVVFSDGEDLNSAFKSVEVTKEAQGLGKFNAFAIDYMKRSSTDTFLSKFAHKHHGQIWKAKSEKNLVAIFQQVASRMQYYYVVSYEFVTTGTLTVTPATLTFNLVNTTFPESRLDVSTLTIEPVIDSAKGIASWKVAVSNSAGNVTESRGEGAPASELKVALPTTDLQTLAAGGDLTVKMVVQDKSGQTLLLSAPPVKVMVFQTSISLAVAPTSLTVEEVKTIEFSPMLGHIYFDKGSSDISARYVRLNGPTETAAFDEQTFRDTRQKYYQILNSIGKRLTVNSAASITLVGCNDNNGVEKGNKKLSAQRAESVKNYLQTVWKIAPERILVKTRNLPAMPSAIHLKEGQAENRRAEIYSTEPLILAPIRSTYPSISIDASEFTLKPVLVSPHGISSWVVTVDNATGNLAHLSGTGSPVEKIRIPLVCNDLQTLATAGDITVKMELKDRAGQTITVPPVPVKVNFVQTSQRLAKKEGLRVQEKYALILFDFNKDTIGSDNQAIISRITDRIKTLTNATVKIVGHTDTIGKAAYNIKLSERRALSAYKLLAAGYGEMDRDAIHHSGVGPNTPLFDNMSPEARAFNRTVTITLEYRSTELAD